MVVHLAGRLRAAEAGERNVLLLLLHWGQCQASAASPAETQLLGHSACPFLHGLKHIFLLVLVCSPKKFPAVWRAVSFRYQRTFRV